MADAINYKDYSVIVLTREERETLSDLLNDYVDFREGESILEDLSTLIGYQL